MRVQYKKFLVVGLVFASFYLIVVFSFWKIGYQDFITKCSVNPVGVGRTQCVLRWFQNNGKNLSLKDSMKVIDDRYESGKVSLRACHIWKHDAVNAVFGTQNVDVKEALTSCSEQKELCDGGCFHTTMEQAVKRYGISHDSLLKFEQMCLGLPNSRDLLECIHGIGHGLALSIDHSFSLTSALDSCDELISKPEFKSACYTGVFMVSTRPDMGMDMKYLFFDAKDPTFPCETVPEKYREACYSEMPSRVYAAGGSFPDAVTTCQKLTQPAWAKACRTQIQRNLAREPMTPTEKQKVCLSMGGDAADCIAMVSTDMASMEKSRYNDLSQFCLGLSGKNSEACHTN